MIFSTQAGKKINMNMRASFFILSAILKLQKRLDIAVDSFGFFNRK
jgi:hypothetical protein